VLEAGKRGVPEIHRIDGNRNYDNNGLPTLIKVP
jgi:hypothetical protein